MHVVTLEVLEHPRPLELYGCSVVEAALMDPAVQHEEVTRASRAYHLVPTA